MYLFTYWYQQINYVLRATTNDVFAFACMRVYVCMYLCKGEIDSRDEENEKENIFNPRKITICLEDGKIIYNLFVKFIEKNICRKGTKRARLM